MLGYRLRAAECDDLGSLAGIDWQECARDDGEAFGRVKGSKIFGCCRCFDVTIDTHEEGGEDAGEAGQFECRRCGSGFPIFNDLKWPLEWIGKVGCRISECAGCGQIEPRRPRDEDRPLTVAGFALIGEFERCGARSGEEDVGRPIGVEGSQARVVRSLDSKQMQRPDRNRPAAAERINRAGSRSCVDQNANSVTSGTWSEGLSQLRQGS